MTSGFDFIVDRVNLILSRSTKLVLYLDEDIVGMLDELAERENRKREDLAAALLIQAIETYFQVTDELVQIWESLPERQQEVAALACLGYTNDQIARKLHISPQTVKTHVSRLLPKFEASGRNQSRYMLKSWDFSQFDPK